MSQRPQSIEIPVRNSNEVVEIFLDDLPSDPSEIKSIIREEEAPLELFLHFAIEYYYQQRFEEFRYLLKEGILECQRRGEKSSQVPLWTAFAAFNVSLGLQNPKKSMEYFEEATVQLNDAERYNHLDISLLLRKGLLLLAQKKLSQAEYQLKIVLGREPNNFAAHIALGCVEFLNGRWESSLSEFQLVLRRLPSSPEDIKLVIGYCLLKMGNVKLAELAFERILSMNPSNIKAIVALAVLYINRGPPTLAKGMQLMKQAYEIDKTNPIVLFHLSNHFFFKKDFVKAFTLTQAALNSNPSITERSNILLILGKLSHVQGNYEEAFGYFTESVKLNPNLILAQLGLGQVCIQRGDFASATGCFERVVELEKKEGKTIKDSEFWAMMGLTKMQIKNLENSDESQNMLKRAIEMGSRSFDLFISMANLYETRNPKDALNAYKEAMKLDNMKFNGNPEILNNYAVMLHICGDLDGASNVLGSIKCELSKDDELSMTVKYNNARILEDQNRFTEADKILKELSILNPTDIVFHLRRGIIASKQGNHNDAAEHYKEAIGLEETNIDAWVLLASNHLRMKALTPARKAFERVLKSHQRHDQFSLIALGNIYIEIARHEKRPELVNENLRRALDFFIKVLQYQAHNHIAANGIGVVLAELGRWKEAKEVFIQIKQADPDFIDASLNLAHCFVELGQYVAAIKIYEQILEKTNGTHKKASILLFMARTCYVQAKTERNVFCFESSISYLTKAKNLLPEDTPILYNIALCQQEVAAALLKKKGEACTDEELEKAMEYLDSADLTFTKLSKLNNQPFDLNIVTQRAKHCQTLRTSLQSRFDLIRASSQNKRARLEEVKQQRYLQQLQNEEREAQEREAKAKEQAKDEEIRRDLAARLKNTEVMISAADQSSSDDDDDDDRPSSRKRRHETSKSNKKIVDDDELMRQSGRKSKLSKELISESDMEDE